MLCEFVCLVNVVADGRKGDIQSKTDRTIGALQRDHRRDRCAEVPIIHFALGQASRMLVGVDSHVLHDRFDNLFLIFDYQSIHDNWRCCESLEMSGSESGSKRNFFTIESAKSVIE